MSAFDLFPSAIAHERGEALDLNAPARFFEGALTAPLKGAAKGLLIEPARVASMAASHVPGAIDRVLGTHTRDWWYENMMLRHVHERVTPNPRETGMAGQILNALFDVGGQALVAGPGGVLISKTVGGTIEGAEKGLDTQTAGKKALLEGATAAIGVGMPLYIPPVAGTRIPALVQQLGYGVGANVPLGYLQRGMTHEILAKGGYREMAEQYKALDETALITDFVLGLAFGGLGHALAGRGKTLAVNPSDVDAALAKRNAYHVEVDTAPGIPTTGDARDAHVAAHLDATAALIEGRPVDVARHLEGVEFTPNPALDKTRTRLLDEQRRLAEAYDKVLGEPIGPVNDPMVLLTPDRIGEVLVERGPAVWKKGTTELRVGGYGLVKFIWKHGEKSSKETESQVTKADVVRTPEVMQNFAPIEDRLGSTGLRETEWQIERADGKRVIYALRQFTSDKRQHVVSIFVNDGANEAMKGKALSRERQNRLPDSPGVALKASPRDTAAATSDSSPQGQAAPSVEQVGAALKAEGLEASAENVAVVRQIAQARAIDARAVDALPDGMPDGEYMAKIKEIINAGTKAQAPGTPGARARGEGSAAAGGEPRPGEEGGQAARGTGGETQPGGKSARLVEEAEIRDAQEVVTNRPDLTITHEDGTTIPAKDALAQADEVIAQAENDTKAFEAAVLCASRRGG